VNGGGGYCLDLPSIDGSAVDVRSCAASTANLFLFQSFVPAAPTNLKITGITTSSIGLGWDPALPSHHYGISFSPSSAGRISAAGVPLGPNAAPVTNRVPSTRYCFNVTAVRASTGPSATSNLICATTATPPPTTPPPQSCANRDGGPCSRKGSAGACLLDDGT